MRKTLAIFLMIIMVAGIFAGCNTEKEKSFQSIEDFENAKIGVLTGSSREDTVKKVLPNAQLVYFSSVADVVLAVEQGKIDAFIEDRPYIIPLIWEGRSLTMMEENTEQLSNGFIFPQSEESKDLRQQINAFLADAKADGTIDALNEKWLGATEPTEIPDYASLSGENGTIHMAICVDNKPILYQRGNDYTG